MNRGPQARSAIPLVHVGLLSSYLDLMSAIGAPVDRELMRVHLPTDLSDRRSGYIPCRSLCEFVDHAGRSQGIEEIGLRAAHAAGVRGIQRGTGARIAASPTLLEGLRRFCDLARGESSQVSIWLEESREELRLCHRGSLPRDTPGQVPMTWWTLGVFVDVIRMFLGRSWAPARMGVPAQGPVGPFARELYPNTRMVAEPEHAWVAIPRGSLPMPAHAPSGPRLPTSIAVETPPEGFVESLRQLLRFYMSGGLPDINRAAEIVSMSARTLQRRLSEFDRTYSQLTEEVRFEFARERLAVPGTKVIDVAYDAGYADPSHFARAFRRISGVTPREYQRIGCQVA